MTFKVKSKFEKEVLQTAISKLENGKQLSPRERVELIRLVDFFNETISNQDGHSFLKATIEIGSHLWTGYEIIELIAGYIVNSP